ncbi:hypothetical protein ACMDCR_28080 [Labrys okinawensis]|uniref:hypothetical protein n=1 Tax=Labrys okinawensis TaxID=346911 RepID=UPI0039BCC3D1
MLEARASTGVVVISTTKTNISKQIPIDAIPLLRRLFRDEGVRNLKFYAASIAAGAVEAAMGGCWPG